MRKLRTVLYIDAALWVMTGLVLAVVPQWLLADLLGLPVYKGYAWVRASGILAISMALLMVLVAQSASQTWYWTWAFVFAEINLSLLFAIKALGNAEGNPAVWWVVAAACALMAAALLWGIAMAYPERPQES